MIKHKSRLCNDTGTHCIESVVWLCLCFESSILFIRKSFAVLPPLFVIASCSTHSNKLPNVCVWIIILGHWLYETTMNRSGRMLIPGPDLYCRIEI
jgi:hypothetical protein